MGDILSNGVSALVAFQQSLATVSNNISNVNTPGYTLERVNLSEQTPQPTGAGYIGNGVLATGVQRVYSQFLNQQVVSSTASDQQLQTLYQLSSQVDNLLGSSQAGLSTALQQFSSALQTVANDPTSAANRQALVSQGDALVQTFHSVSGQLSSLGGSVNQSLANDAGQITTIAQGIAQLNQKIVASGSASSAGQAPNALLDQRDALVTKLAKLVSVTTTTQSNGALNVFIGNGQGLVVGTTAGTLSAVPSATNAAQTDLTLSFGKQATVVTDQLNGGDVGGLLQFQSQVLTPSINALGRIAIGMASQFNAQQHLGVDQNGQIGGDMFSVPTTQVLTNASGTSSVTASVQNPALLTTSDYQLSYSGSAWTLTRLSDGTNVALSGNGTATSPLTGDGLSIVVSGTPQAGDRYLLQPTGQAAQQISMAFSDPTKIAAAAAVTVNAAVDSAGNPLNSGNAQFSGVAATGAATLPLGSDITFTYNSSTQTFSYSGGASGSFTYNPATDSGKTFTAAGIQFQITGTPANGDQFVMSNTGSGSGDNTNALAMAGLMNQKTLSNNTASFSDAYAQLVASVGTQTQQADTGQKAQAALLQQAQQARDSVSGVNLDQQAAKLVQFQQSYQAAAKVIATGQTLFQSLLQAV